MFEILLDGESYGSQGNLRDSLIETIDQLIGNPEPGLAITYKKYMNYTDEDLVEEIFKLKDVAVEIRINHTLDQKLSASSQLLE